MSTYSSFYILITGTTTNSMSNISSLRDITMGSKAPLEHPATQAKPLYPDLCLEYVWTESQTPKRLLC